MVQEGDLAALVGPWEGALVYRDYTSGKSTRIPVKAVGVMGGSDDTAGRSVKLRFSYPNEPGHDHEDDFSVSADGRTLGGVAVIERTAVSPGALRIVLEERGTDGNDRKPATFRHVLLVGARSLSLTKLVRFDGSAEFFERNGYQLGR